MRDPISPDRITALQSRVQSTNHQEYLANFVRLVVRELFNGAEVTITDASGTKDYFRCGIKPHGASERVDAVFGSGAPTPTGPHVHPGDLNLDGRSRATPEVKKVPLAEGDSVWFWGDDRDQVAVVVRKEQGDIEMYGQVVKAMQGGGGPESYSALKAATGKRYSAKKANLISGMSVQDSEFFVHHLVLGLMEGRYRTMNA